MFVLAVLMSCAAPPPVSWERAPGWYSLPDEQANRSWGALNFGWTSATRLEGQVSLTGEAPGRKLYLAVRWAGATEPSVLTEPFDSAFSVEVSPPAAAREDSFGRVCTGERAAGLLLAYLSESGVPDPSRDELVSVSVKQRGVFSSLQVLYSQPFGWDSCSGPRPLVPLLLQHDPRLQLALCAPDCVEPLIDRTHVVSAELDLTPGSAWFSVDVLGQEAVAVEVNGAAVAADDHQRSRWREGLNTVKVTSGTLAPWTAEVVLPSGSLSLDLHEGRLVTGAPFTLEWQAPWALDAWVSLRPLEVPTLKVGDPWFAAEGESLTDTFPGFFDARGCARAVGRASVEVRARKVEGPFSISVTESLEVPVGSP